MFEKVRKRPSDDGGNGNDRLMAIREVSALTGVPPHTLRFWEKEMPDILCPKRTAGGQRRYDSEMAERVMMIKRFSDEKKYSLAAIRKHIGSSHGIMDRRIDPSEGVYMEQIVKLIVDEISDLLHERLASFLETGRSRNNGNGQSQS